MLAAEEKSSILDFDSYLEFNIEQQLLNIQNHLNILKEQLVKLKKQPTINTTINLIKLNKQLFNNTEYQLERYYCVIDLVAEINCKSIKIQTQQQKNLNQISQHIFSNTTKILNCLNSQIEMIGNHVDFLEIYIKE